MPAAGSIDRPFWMEVRVSAFSGERVKQLACYRWARINGYDLQLEIAWLRIVGSVEGSSDVGSWGDGEQDNGVYSGWS